MKKKAQTTTQKPKKDSSCPSTEKQYLLKSPLELTKNILLTFLVLFLSLLLTYSLWRNILNVSNPETFFMMFIVAIFTLTAWAITSFAIFNAVVYPFADQNGIGLKLFRKVLVHFSWDEIIDSGEGKVYNFFRFTPRFYVSKEKLSKKDRENLDLIKSNIIFFSYLPKNLPENILSRLKFSSNRPKKLPLLPKKK